VWLAVLVTVGVRSLTAALLAGISFTVLPAVFQTYLTSNIWLQVPSVLFGLGAIGLATNPEGVVAMYARGLQSLIFTRLFKGLGGGAEQTGEKLGDLDTESVLQAAHEQSGGNGTRAGTTVGLGMESSR
jgi:hypothetical protein